MKQIVRNIFLYLSVMPILVVLPRASAEYRAYNLTITNSATGQTRSVITTFDHIQFPYYFPLKRTEKAELSGSWMCWGRTSDFKKTCANPNPPNTESPAAAVAPSTASSGVPPMNKQGNP